MTDHPHLPGKLAGSILSDAEASWPVSSSESKYESPYVSLGIDTIVAPDGAEHARAVVSPNHAIGILALDDEDRLLLVEQYRHPVRRRLLEIPAGTLDVPGESALDASIRELAEEADLIAGHWEPQLKLLATPGYSTEAWQVFTATDLSPVPEADRIARHAEEADMVQWWMPFDEAVDAVLAGRISDSLTVAAILAAQVLRSK
ncbi:ADP-ribose pyrophosphatase [Aeromicrobium panaciterrae]|uniref:ADP-ribose pyrophosphatase n=1 Tax=Aeromicrobium panaciterrae TaxID=363861 RepID=A0ABU1UNT1_9ACTN|nr:NUDIX hydrolase [Aeromicrobium panaciterrae]MDR7086809.1 ADP-ribose pyrophosphatase [Aeromicrobium panaciterrae]